MRFAYAGVQSLLYGGQGLRIVDGADEHDEEGTMP